MSMENIPDMSLAEVRLMPDPLVALVTEAKDVFLSGVDGIEGCAAEARSVFDLFDLRSSNPSAQLICPGGALLLRPLPLRRSVCILRRLAIWFSM
mmetsp:Transcript_28415/g.64656  ORF Transcript_28415/g.64656 Transcript_28415/m.64656 type:complete len:95 (-) Transcript_28415:765-1049(-)